MRLDAAGQEDLFYSAEQIQETSFGSGRWTEHMETIVRHENGSYYRIRWQRGLTEYQDDEFESGELEEVFPLELLSVKSKTVYLSEDQLNADRPTLAHRMEDDGDSFKIVTGKELRAPLSKELYDAVGELRERIHELEPLDLAGESGVYREATKQYLDAVMALWETKQ